MYQDSLFSADQPHNFNFCGAQLQVHPSFIESEQAYTILENLSESLPWEQSIISIAGKDHKIPRLNCWMADANAPYSYSGASMQIQPWNLDVLNIKKQIEHFTQKQFNSVLINLYRDGDDSVGWHSDDEQELGQNPYISVLSLGGTRRFDLRSKLNHQNKLSIELEHASLLIMNDSLQHTSQHCIKKTARFCAPRISLTFRTVYN